MSIIKRNKNQLIAQMERPNKAFSDNDFTLRRYDAVRNGQPFDEKLCKPLWIKEVVPRAQGSSKIPVAVRANLNARFVDFLRRKVGDDKTLPGDLSFSFADNARLQRDDRLFIVIPAVAIPKYQQSFTDRLGRILIHNDSLVGQIEALTADQ